MKIGIIGAGNVGGTLGKLWAAKGQEIMFRVPNPHEVEVQEEVKSIGKPARAGSVKEAASGLACCGLSSCRVPEPRASTMKRFDNFRQQPDSRVIRPSAPQTGIGAWAKAH